MLEFRAALLLGHAAAARTVLGWLTERIGDSAELLVMRGWADAAAGHHEHAPRPDPPGTGRLHARAAPAHRRWRPGCWRPRSRSTAGERPAARHALQTALALAEPLDALRPFAQAGPNVRELLVHQHGSFGASDEFADRALAVGAGQRAPDRPS